MFSLYTIDVTSQRIEETQRAVVEQRKYLTGLSDPELKAIAARTLTTLEDMLLIMQRTHGLLVEAAYMPDSVAMLTVSSGSEATARI